MTDGRFDYIEYDDHAKARSQTLTAAAYNLLNVIESVEASRERSLAITKLEEAIMWAGKAIRGQQRNRT